MGTKTVKCRICGRDIIWIRDSEKKPVAINASLRYYRKCETPREPTDRLYTAQGIQLRGRLLRDEDRHLAAGTAHTVHYCRERGESHGDT